MVKKIKNTIIDLILDSSVQVLLKYFKSKRLIYKLTWIIFIVISASLCSWFGLKCLFDYLKYDVFTIVESVYEQPTQFPTITFTTSDRRYPLSNRGLKSLIIECWFNYDKSCEFNPGNYFETFNNTNTGLSFRFNSGRNMSGHKIPFLNSTIGGRDDSFRIKINSGLTLWIHNHTSIPNAEFYNNHNGDMRFASAGFQTQFILDKIIETKLGEPYNSCLLDVTTFNKNKTIIDYILGQNQSYEQKNCLELCFDLEYVSQNPCNCTAPIGRIWEECWIMKEMKNFSACTLKYKEYFYKQDITKICEKYCPLECVSFTNSVSVDSIPYLNSTISYVVIYFRSLKYTAIRQEPKIFVTDLVSSAGGTFSLFLGLTLVNLTEALEIIIETIFVLFERKKLKESNEKTINVHY